MSDSLYRFSSNLKDKIPPHNIEAEQAVLGALLLDSNVLGTVIELLTTESFYSIHHQKIFQAIIDLSNQGQQIDILVLTDYLRTQNILDSVGGGAYIASLTDLVPTTANVEYYSKIVADAAIRRALLRVSHTISAKAYDETSGSGSIIESAQKEIYDLTNVSKTASFKLLKELIPELIAVIESRYHQQNEYTGIATGLTALDDLTGGFQDSELIIIGARPSMGKTALAMTMASNIAIKQKIPTAFFSLEMSDMLLMQRLLAAESGISATSLRKGLLQLSDFGRIQNAAGEMYDAPLYISDIPNMKMLDLRAAARRLCAQEGVKIIFVDYLGLIVSDNPLIPRYEQFAEISQSLKGLARELNIPIVALSQVGRPAEGSPPSLADIRGSGAIEQDADVVMFLHRERGEADTQLILAKQRNGPIGTITLEFQASYTRFICKEQTA
ncbi:replicative DNA helicase [Treponema phagedenis]|uniref:Replicative DNA helicase n=1 Tax=Treponema phagedenis TaxID=162 RepID=A0A0B7GQM9_TREPH|nr:replicative DNA helicase [Treponema phagedenis]NVP24603.1 replicative DNA helicase [Treponema phagedenis]QEJ94704.1 replicative DNA helicase [Treponema phagedenis]QEJ97640.1 replicative DNA helicase [Treponema phagedenis]QEK00608.1 replicative DNA helicase [Treponema phagedenis]QEK03208.1 replicative DNA helicase [Treponema phagedenis]